MWDVGHGLGAARDDDGGVAGHDCLGAEYDGLQAGGTDFVDGGADCSDREGGVECALTCWVLTEAGQKDSYVSSVSC